MILGSPYAFDLIPVAVTVPDKASLIFQISELFTLFSAGISTLSYAHGCRGFIGPVPLPLWIRTVGAYE